MTKGFYKLMCLAAAAAMSIIGCGPEDDPTVEYGPGPTDYDTPGDIDQTDMDATLYGDIPVDFDNSIVPDTDEPVISDDPPMEYGPIQTDYDDLATDTDEPVVTPDEPAMEYGPQPVDYDAAGTDAVIEQPDEMTTDYGPVSRSFLKK